jgi:hypothetical protein
VGHRAEQGYRGQQGTEGNRLNRLLLVLFLALWWAHTLGMRAVKLGLRRLFDRSDRRELSVVRLGGRWVQHLLDRDRPHPALLRYRPSSDSFTTLCYNGPGEQEKPRPTVPPLVGGCRWWATISSELTLGTVRYARIAISRRTRPI